MFLITSLTVRDMAAENMTASRKVSALEPPLNLLTTHLRPFFSAILCCVVTFRLNHPRKGKWEKSDLTPDRTVAAPGDPSPVCVLLFRLVQAGVEKRRLCFSLRVLLQQTLQERQRVLLGISKTDGDLNAVMGACDYKER
jgi:hypothetical protein